MCWKLEDDQFFWGEGQATVPGAYSSVFFWRGEGDGDLYVENTKLIKFESWKISSNYGPAPPF